MEGKRWKENRQGQLGNRYVRVKGKGETGGRKVRSKKQERDSK